MMSLGCTITGLCVRAGQVRLSEACCLISLNTTAGLLNKAFAGSEDVTLGCTIRTRLHVWAVQVMLIEACCL